MKAKKENCWDVMKCGRGPGNGGPVCPAATEQRLDGVHGGVNGGRACWVVAGTMCEGLPPSGRFAQRMESCIGCVFYRKVRAEEPGLLSHHELLLRVFSGIGRSG